MYQIISLSMVEAQKQHREGSADAGRQDLYKLWHCGLRFLPMLVWVHEGEINPQLWVAECIFGYPQRFQKGDKSYHLCQRGTLWTWAQEAENPLLELSSVAIPSLKAERAIARLSKNLQPCQWCGMPILGQGQATGTWECNNSQRWKRGDKYLELKPVSIAHLKWTGFHFYKSQNKVEKQTLICLMSLEELLEKLHHWAESTLGCVPAPAWGLTCKGTSRQDFCPALLLWDMSSMNMGKVHSRDISQRWCSEQFPSYRKGIWSIHHKSKAIFGVIQKRTCRLCGKRNIWGRMHLCKDTQGDECNENCLGIFFFLFMSLYLKRQQRC